MPRIPLIHIVDDDEAVRRSLGDLLRSHGYNIETYQSAAEFMEAARFDAPGCVLLDVRLGNISGLTIQEELRDQNVTSPVILMTGFGDVPTSVKAMKAGAVDFLTKPLEEEALFAAVSAAVERDRDRREVIAAMRALQQRYATLTPREREVAHLVYTGLMNKQIAADLDISEVTVKLHRGSAMRKMAANSLAHFVRMIGALDSRVLSDKLEGA